MTPHSPLGCRPCHASSALNCLMEYYGVEEDIPVVERPGLALSIESSLGITAGRQRQPPLCDSSPLQSSSAPQHTIIISSSSSSSSGGIIIIIIIIITIIIGGSIIITITITIIAIIIFIIIIISGSIIIGGSTAATSAGEGSTVLMTTCDVHIGPSMRRASGPRHTGAWPHRTEGAHQHNRTGTDPPSAAARTR